MKEKLTLNLNPGIYGFCLSLAPLQAGGVGSRRPPVASGGGRGGPRAVGLHNPGPLIGHDKG